MTAPYPQGDIGDDEKETECYQYLGHFIMHKAVKEQFLHEDTQHTDGRRASQQAQPEYLGLSGYGDSYIGPQQVIGAVG